MAVWNGQVLWSFMVLLAGAVAQNVNYPVRPVCAMKGSTVTLPCTFTYKEIAEKNGRNVSMQIVRVLWCKNHEICQGTTPSVYDSESETNSRRFQYLGDKKGNCTLQISNVQMEDNATFRFRMEANVPVQNFTGKIGVNVTVNNNSKMRINSSSDAGETRGGETVTLRCTSECSFYPLAINWSKDGLILPESGPVLRIGPVTAKDSGNYTCALKNKPNTGCMPYSMQVKEAKADVNLPLIVGVVFGVLLAVITLILVFFIIRRRRVVTVDQIDVGGETEEKHRDYIYSNIMPSAELEEVYDRPQTSRAVEDVSYAAVQFKHNKQKRQMQEAEDSTVYSSVATQD
ncbi:V-set and immunoglobulin domain-containing protein 2-like [Acanthochromis polyacanthus]|uniref:V-set and immunoglobulin domain-containing protein 2-like n=1 Tax=Acanthochromis polyacanthus TaxID=80966 RepID=UPI002233EE1C|nr:V-set and immunoglobulin domain-containing protein 2-like [Acanthochromis polyacanthus]